MEVYGIKDGKESASDPVYGATMAHGHRFSIPVRHCRRADLALTGGQYVLSYEFSRIAPGRESVGAAHASELPHVFGTLSVAGRGGSPSRYESTDSAVSGQIQQYWTNFAKTGNPNGGSLPK